MDITFKTDDGVFNYRVAGVIIHEGKVLVMTDDRVKHFMLPGGRVGLHESSKEAVVREVAEELGEELPIIRPLWINEGFFEQEWSGRQVHELAFYFLLDASGSSLVNKGDEFTLQEDDKLHTCKWVPIEKLKDETFYPLFLKEKILDLPDHLEMMIEME